MKTNYNKNDILTAKHFSAVNIETGKTLWFSDLRSPQHLYPLTQKDYCEAIAYSVQNGISNMPILSISVKDFPYCDFECKDCLAVPSRKWATTNNNITYPIIPIDTYKKILDEISLYSSKRGCDNVRFEICGEGNPDLYKDRIEMIEYATQKCNMGIVYVSTGSKIDDDLLNCLVENAAFIRISFPGISPESYSIYSNQKSKSNEFSYTDAINLLKKLCLARTNAGRDDSLLIGVRTCIRPLNAGHYDDFISTISNIGVDVFQGVKVLTPDFESVKEEVISPEVIKELFELREKSRIYGLKDFQIPDNLNTLYNNRTLCEAEKPSKCWSSLISPPLYGTNLISCVLWDKITDLKYHYGIMTGAKNELEQLMHSKKAKYIMNNCPKSCTSCPSSKDNNFIESVWRILKIQDDLSKIKFITSY